jgi:hypothetical protein
MKSLLFTGLVAAATISSNVSAGWEVGDTMTVSRAGTAPARAIRFSFDAARSYNEFATGADYFGLAGVSVFDKVNGSGRIKTFCVEMNEGFVDDPIVYTLTEIGNVPEHAPPGQMTVAKQTLMNDLFARYYRQVMDYIPYQATDADKNMAAAFQLAIWEISHENLTSDSDASSVLGELDITVGAMAFTDTFNSETASLASSMLGSLGDGGFRTMGNLFGLTNPNNQDMLIVVPTPAIAGLAGLGLAGMRRRRR